MKFASYTTSPSAEDLSNKKFTHIGVQRLANGANNFKLNGKTVQLGAAGRWEISYKYLENIISIILGDNQILYIEYEEGADS